MDYTIEVWSIIGTHYASCNCLWKASSDDQDMLVDMVQKHRKAHHDKGEYTEVV